MQYIFIHGLMQNSSSWEKVISHLPESVLTNCLNLSDLVNGKDLTYQNLYEALERYCEKITEPFALCGISLGGILALNYAVDHAEKVDSLILIAAQFKMPKQLLKFQNFIFKILPKASFKKLGFEKVEIIRLTNSMLDLDFSKNLASIPCKTSVVCGSKDKANLKAAKVLAEQIHGAKLNLIAGSGHEVNVDAPMALASIIVQ